ncbi:imelysin family protein [Phaeobacter sp. C3_T13_0]|uniref:imelysin family protein n=1 Tax=Phaeobacter cretensis TaxID=3342641 RepID=UPI0039BC8E98
MLKIPSLPAVRLLPAIPATLAIALTFSTWHPRTGNAQTGNAQAGIVQSDPETVAAPAMPPVALASDQQVEWILTNHILPGFDGLAETSAELAKTGSSHCSPDDPALRKAFGLAFDAWVTVSHLRFGPTETENRAFALAFWPDSRNKIPGALRRAITETNRASLSNPDTFASQSIALRGFYALEYLLFDDAIQSDVSPDQHSTDQHSADRHCALVTAIATDIARTTASIRDDWHRSYATTLRTPGPDNRYQSSAEVRQELFKSLTTGFQVLSDMRLGRPLGQFDSPRPKRAEARRSGRSLRHIVLNLTSMEPLALALAAGDAILSQDIEDGFAKTLNRAMVLDDPSLAGVADPARRFRIESLQQDVNDLRDLITTELGPTLGVTAGFNSLDGD